MIFFNKISTVPVFVLSFIYYCHSAAQLYCVQATGPELQFQLHTVF